MRTLSLASALLASTALMAPDGLGGGLVAVAMQSYDPNAAGYISPEAAALLPDAFKNGVATVRPAPVMATVQAAEIAQPVKGIDPADAGPAQADTSQSPATGGASAEEVLADLARRVADLESRDSRANSILAWAEKVLQKYHDNPNDKPEVQGNVGDIA